MTIRFTRTRLAAGLLAVMAVALAGCTGVPSDSAPVVVRTVPIGGSDSQAAATTPASGILPNTLVADFLQANALDASQQTSPRGFLSPAARNSWSDSVVTVVDTPVVGFYNAKRGTVVVTARVLGTVDAAGVYTAMQGASTAKQKFVYGVRLVDGQYRIASLRNGLLLSESDFTSYYPERTVYYFDLAHHYLVPDPRWTSLTDPTQLADFLMSGLAGDPSPSIENVVSTDTLPLRATATRISVIVQATTKIEIPGSSQLGSLGRDRLAEQVAATLADVPRLDELVITDGGKAVNIPDAHGTRFTSAEFAGRTGPPAPPADVYFLRKGQLYGQDGDDATRLKGAVNNREYFLQSVAVSQDKQQSTNAIAATAGSTTSRRQLLVGTQSDGLRQTSVRGALTRPAFAPGRSEVWVGDGAAVYAVAIDNQDKTERPVRVGLPSDAGGGRIVALRLSPDGSRVALVIASAGPQHQQQVFVGAVMRAPGQISINSLQPVTPPGVVITDVAWAEPLKLLAIGHDAAHVQHVYDVGSDGSAFGAQGIGNLPNTPTTLAVAVHKQAWVTVGAAVWEQSFNNVWVSPEASPETAGYAAVYLE